MRFTAAVDLGTSAVRVCRGLGGTVTEVPGVIAVDTHTGDTVAVGEAARAMRGRTPGNLRVVSPIREGTVADYDLAVRLVAEALASARVRRPNVLTAVPSDLTDEEAEALSDVLSDAGARTVRQIPSALAAALGAGYSPDVPGAWTCVDIGAGVTDAAVLRRGTVIAARSSPSAGAALDRALLDFLRERYGLLLGDVTAEAARHMVGTAHPSVDRGSVAVSGRNLETGLIAARELTSPEVFEAYLPVIRRIVRGISDLLEALPPEIAAEARENGITLTGAGAALPGLAKAIAAGTGVRVISVPEGALCTVRGLWRVATEKIPVSKPRAQNDGLFRQKGSK